MYQLNHNRYVTIAEAQKLAGRSRATVMRWLKMGRLRSIKMGGGRLIPHAELVAVVQEMAKHRGKGRGKNAMLASHA